MAADSIPSPPPTDCYNIKVMDHIAYVEVLVVLIIVATFLLHVLGSLRRWKSHGLLHDMVAGINTLSYPLVGYTIGWMNHSTCYVEDYAVWAVFMLLLLGSTDNLTVCRLDDIENWRSTYVKHLFKGFLVVYIVVNITSLQKQPFPSSYLHPLLAILVVGLLKWYVRIASMRMVSKSYLSRNMKVIADYMEMEHLDDSVQQRPFDPATMKGYKYIVAGEKYCTKHQAGGCMPWSLVRSTASSVAAEDSSRVTTVEQIWECKGNLPFSEPRGMLHKDMCLSMALSKMLIRRFAGFKLSEAGLDKTHDFVFKGLLNTRDEPYYQRAFRVIEEELVFVHDVYYTRYSYLYQKGRYLPLCLPTIMCGLCLWLTYVIVRDNSHALTALTTCITVVLAFLEAYQLYLYVASGWFKVALIRSYVATLSLQGSSSCFKEMIIGLLLRLKAFRPWKHRLGQYCFLEEIGRKNRFRTCLHYATLRLVDKKAKKGHMKSVKLPDNVKKAVVDSLLTSEGNLTNGVKSLQLNGVHGHLAWACDATDTSGSVTRTILVWHIATILCKHKLDAQAKQEDKEEESKRKATVVMTATTLSQYCMHLLAFSPNLLPDHSSTSESILDRTIEAADKILKDCKTKEKLCDKLLLEESTHNINDDGEEAQLLWKGARLANHLMIEDKIDPALRWKVLAEFWAEMMLYVSPSDDARAHLERLARGGEFITHLWALLTHAGILNRDPSPTVP